MHINLFIFIIMKTQEQKFLEHACEKFENVIDAATLVENGDVELSIDGLLRCYAILQKWYTCYETQAELRLLNEDVAILASCETFMSILSSHIERFEEIFVDFEIEILGYFKANGKAFSEQQTADALIFDKMAQNNDNIAFKDWKTLMN